MPPLSTVVFSDSAYHINQHCLSQPHVDLQDRELRPAVTWAPCVDLVAYGSNVTVSTDVLAFLSALALGDRRPILDRRPRAHSYARGADGLTSSLHLHGTEDVSMYSVGRHCLLLMSTPGLHALRIASQESPCSRRTRFGFRIRDNVPSPWFDVDGLPTENQTSRNWRR